jgi:hypothetical protein
VSMLLLIWWGGGERGLVAITSAPWRMNRDNFLVLHLTNFEGYFEK